MKFLLVIAAVWLLLGAAGAFLIDEQRPMTMTDVALGPISLARDLLA